MDGTTIKAKSKARPVRSLGIVLAKVRMIGCSQFRHCYKHAATLPEIEGTYTSTRKRYDYRCDRPCFQSIPAWRRMQMATVSNEGRFLLAAALVVTMQGTLQAQSSGFSI